MLMAEFRSLLERGGPPVFARKRSQLRAIGHPDASGLPCVMGRRTISRAICALGRADRDWSADYKMFSRSRWQPQRLFAPVIDDYLVRYPDGPIVVAVDDTKTAKTGKKIATAFWQRDPMWPPFQVNFSLGLGFVPRCIGVVSALAGGQLLGAWVSGGV